MSIRVKVEGIGEEQDRTSATIADLRGAPMLQAMRQAALYVTRDARKFAPVDTGRLRASINPEIRVMSGDLVGVVGSNVEYAPHVELGTRPHWPPLAALEPWARRHGLNAYLVARAIARRGTKAHYFLLKAYMQNRDTIYHLLSSAVDRAIDQ